MLYQESYIAKERRETNLRRHSRLIGGLRRNHLPQAIQTGLRRTKSCLATDMNLWWKNMSTGKSGKMHKMRQMSKMASSCCRTKSICGDALGTQIGISTFYSTFNKFYAKWSIIIFS